MPVHLGHVMIDVEHLLAALSEQPGSSVARLFAKLDIPLEALTAELDKGLKRRPRISQQQRGAGTVYLWARGLDQTPNAHPGAQDQKQSGPDRRAGVGKTELAKALAEALFDEIEKSHPDVFNVFLQAMDNDRLTDAHGRTVDFKNTAIITTSNIGSHALVKGADKDGAISDKARSTVMEELASHFRPAFLTRVDEIVLFKTLRLPEIKSIVRLLSDDIRQRPSEKDITLIAQAGFDPV